MFRTLRPLFLAPLALTLWGCTFTLTTGPEDPKNTQATQKAAPSRKAARPTAHTAPTATAAPTRPTASPTADVAPRITSPIAFGNGRGGAFRGLAYVLPAETRSMPNLSNLVPFATLFTDSFQVKSQAFSGGFPGALQQDEWFAIRYEGAFSIPRDGSYKLRLVSDDGAIVSIDGQVALANDVARTGPEASTQRELKAGVHQLRLDYYQGKKGTVALMLFLGSGGQEQPLVGKK